MTLPRPVRLLPPALLLVALALLPGADAQTQKKKAPKADGPAVDPDGMLKPAPRPKKGPLPASQLPLEFTKGERIAFLGNSTAERMSLFGHFETMLHLRFPDKQLVVRNFGRPAEEVGIHQRSADYTLLDDPLYAFNADTFLCFFGFNESFAGPAGVEKFKQTYEKFLDEYGDRYRRDDAGSRPRFVLVSPVAVESSGDRLMPDAAAQNKNLELYAAAVKAVAAKRKLAFVDVFTLSRERFEAEPGMQFTINGCHLNDAGDAAVAGLLEAKLFDGKTAQTGDTAKYEKIRKAVVDKAWHHNQDHRMVNGWYVYGGRRTYDTETFPREFVKLRNMVAVRDQYVWDIAAGKPVADKPDDSKTGDLIVPPTRFGAPGRSYSENPELKYQTPDEFIKSVQVPPGFEIKLFADEKMFPDIAKPVQINFDNKGRLWVSCMPNYPGWRPGDPPPGDKLVILEDTDGDGKADKSTVFYDKLHCPTGFEFYNGGVLVMSQPRMLWLKDTDGDDKADQVVELLDGWATDDTHHRGGFEWSHGGRLHLLEGIATSTTLETPWGPHHSLGDGGAYVFDPKTQKMRQFKLPGQANMWCYVFDEWGQGIVGDGTTATHHWDTPLSGQPYPARKSLNAVFNNEGMRPALGCEWLVSRHFPPEVQKQFTYACVINMNGMPRFTIKDDGAGFAGTRMKLPDGKPDDLIRSTDKHFRPADPQIGPDGALWFGDWANALIGHMQYSQRDPNRDHVRGRIYRLVAKDRPLLKPVTQFGKSVAEICEQFREYEWRTRYRARRELHDRPGTEVLPAVAAWAAALKTDDPEYDRLVCEALWVQSGHHAVDPKLLDVALKAKTPQARAAAVHITADEREYLPGALDRLKAAAVDTHPRVRVEAVRALSFYPEMPAVEAILASAALSKDYWSEYTINASLGATENVWKAAYKAGTLAKDNPAGRHAMTDVLAGSATGGMAAPYLKTLLGTDPKSPEEKNKAMMALAQQKGNASKGREVFQRNCIACHRAGMGEGQDYGPNMDKVGTRLNRYKLVESVIDPNADVDKKYLSTRIETADGKTVTGLVIAETKDKVTIFDGKEKKEVAVADIADRKVLKQSSMPEGLAGAIAPSEFVDLMEYLASLK